MKDYPFQVGDIIVPIGESNRHSEIVHINFDYFRVAHKCLMTDNMSFSHAYIVLNYYKLHPDNERFKKLKAFR